MTLISYKRIWTLPGKQWAVSPKKLVEEENNEIDAIKE